MITHNNIPLYDMDDYEKALGTPSAQKVIALLVCWNSLAFKEIVQKTGMSESQIHTTLKSLTELNIVLKERRGIYSISHSKFVMHLKTAYEDIIEQTVDNMLYFLSKNIDSLPVSELERKSKALIDQWEPFLYKHFSNQVSSLSSHIIDRLS
ncbi:MAG: hypothetical protein BAJALOKI1v1_590014 [Promethearchaeota archaeon]|nr:MAG: hypothetical protein BAJALOKI1v1_590014 [Candidatus Lokiarchaeota archaeon]